MCLNFLPWTRVTGGSSLRCRLPKLRSSLRKNDLHELYFMCDDLLATMKSLKGKKVGCGPVHEERWGSVTTIVLPGGGKIGLYQAKHRRRSRAEIG